VIFIYLFFFFPNPFSSQNKRTSEKLEKKKIKEERKEKKRKEKKKEKKEKKTKIKKEFLGLKISNIYFIIQVQ